jgi:hypothetical protein
MTTSKYAIDNNNKNCSILDYRTGVSTPLIAQITLWKPNNRLSYLRCLQFMDKFTSKNSIENISIKTRTSKIKNYSRYSFNLAHNFEFLRELLKKLPDAEISLKENQYVISYNFYRFLIQIHLSTLNDNNLLLLNQLLEHHDT